MLIDLDTAASSRLTEIVACGTDAEALECAMRTNPKVLAAVADLLHLEFDATKPRKVTVAKAVAKEARG